MIVLKNVSKTISDNKIVKNINLVIGEKEFVVIVGPSGCGKSTTLRMIAGLEEITEGELYINGKFSNFLESQKRNLSMVFQNYALYPYMNVYDNIAFSLKARKMKKKDIDKKVREAAKKMEIDKLLDRKINALSGGQKQRVAIASAIVRKPDVFLMDEPLSNLDAKLRQQMRVTIQRLYRELDTSVVYVTHDQTEAMTLATKIVVMKDGKIMQIGTPGDVYDNPDNIFTAGFIGVHQMNFIEGYLEKREGLRFIMVDNELKIPERLACMIDVDRYEKRKLLLGVRPENVYIDMDSPVSAEIDYVENLGCECVYDMRALGTTIKMTAKRDYFLDRGDVIGVSFNEGGLLLFDKESGDNIIGRKDSYEE